MKWIVPASLCLAIFHSPEGGEIRIETKQILAVRDAAVFKQHVASGVKTIIYAANQNFGVVETVGEVEAVIDECGN